jgi:phage baseplate assembly protein W
MANGKTYGITFPFQESRIGKYLSLTQTKDSEIRSSLMNLILTRKGSRYYLPNFGTRLYEYIFEPLDVPTFDSIESDIRQSVETYMPNLKINNIRITAASSEETDFVVTTEGNAIDREFKMPGLNQSEYTAKVRIDYTITDDAFSTKDFIIINI